MNAYILDQNQAESINKVITNFIKIEPILITKGEHAGNYFLLEKVFQNPHCGCVSTEGYQKISINSINELI